MISAQLVEEAESFLRESLGRYRRPPLALFELATLKGQELADQLGAQKDIVKLGTLFMDCLLPQAIAEGCVGEHISMSWDKASEIISKYPEVSDEEKENIHHCVLEHHGVDSFYSLESEACCNADCYKFLSVEGIMINIRGNSDLSTPDLMKLLSNKVDEKWNAVSIPSVREDLMGQHDAIKEFLKTFLERVGE